MDVLSSGLGAMPPPNATGENYLYITDNHVTDAQLTTSLWLNTVLGAICFVAFCILQRTVFPMHYRHRQHSPYVTMKPTPLAEDGLKSLYDWFIKACTVSETDILSTVGLDAMVMIKGLSTGLQMFTPLALIGCTVLLPIHYQYRTLDNRDINRSQLMQLTIAALPRGSKLMWVHFVLIVLYNVWAMYVLYERTKEFVFVRQHYLVRGDDPNYWLKSTRQEKAEELLVKVKKFVDEFNKSKRNGCNEAGPEALKEQDPGGSASPPAVPSATSPQLAVRESSQSATFRNLPSVFKSWNNMFNSVTNSWRGKGHLLHQFQRGSFDSYKPYTNETSPIASPPVMSPHGSSVSGAAFQQQQQPWGLAHRTGAGNSLHSSSEGLESGAEGSVGDGLGLSAGGTASVGGSLTGLTGSVGGVDSSTAAAAATAAGSLSGGSSRRWSSSSGGTSDSGVGAARGVELAGGDIASRRLRLPAKAAGKGIRMPPTLGSDGVPPTHQTISELHSMQLPGPVTLQDTPWPPLMPKHMRTITEDSLEYRLESSQGNTSRPSSRGGVMSGVGHNRASSAGTGDLSAASPSSAANSASLHCRTPMAALSGSLVAGLADGGRAHRHSHSHSHSGGSGSGGPAGAPAATPSPLSRATSATGQPQAGSASPAGVALGSSNGGCGPSQQQQQGFTPLHQGAGIDISNRGSIDSLGPSSVCTRITHNSSSGRSSPCDPAGGSSEDDEDCNSRPNTNRSCSPPLGGSSSSRASGRALSPSDTAVTETASTASVGSAAPRDISFGGSLAVSQQRSAAQDDVALSAEHVQLEGLAGSSTPSVSALGPAAAGRLSRHGYETSVDFSALHLEDLSRADTPLSPEDGGFLSPEPMGSRRRRVTAGSAGGRWSPFASCEQLASTIAADGVAGEDACSAEVQQVPGTQSHAVAEAAAGSGRAQGSEVLQGRASNKQRFLRPGPGWHPPSPAAVSVLQLDSGEHSGSEQLQQHQEPAQLQQQAAAPHLHAADAAVAGAVMGAGDTTSAGSSNSHRVRGNAQQQGGLEQSLSDHTTRPMSASGVQSSRSQRQRVAGQYSRTGSAGGGHSGRNSSEPSPTFQHQMWQQGGWQQQSSQPHSSRGTGSSATSNSGHSRLVSPIASTQVTPRDSAVAGASVGAGQELTAAAVAAAVGTGTLGGQPYGKAAAIVASAAGGLSGSAMQRVHELMFDDREDRQGSSRGLDGQPPPVAFHWWKELPVESIRKVDSAPRLADEDQMAFPDLEVWTSDGPQETGLLAKPSVRYRKTINVMDRYGNDMGVGAQHYAVLVTDVQQWPYPELQLEHEAARKERFLYKAWSRVCKLLRAVPESLSWGLHTQHPPWYHAQLQQQEQHSLEQYQHEQQQLLSPTSCVKQSDRHSFEIPEQAATAAAVAAAGGTSGGAANLAGHAAAAAIAGGTSGGASFLGRGSRGTAGKQMSSCATSSEGVGGAGGGNPLSRASMGSHNSHLSTLQDVKTLGMGADELLTCAEQELEAAKQQFLRSVDASADPHSNKAKQKQTWAQLQKLQAAVDTLTQESQRHLAISREQSLLQLGPASRTTSYMRLAPTGYTAGGGMGGAAPAMAASRASSFRSSRHLRADAVAGAAVGVPDWSHRVAAAPGTAGTHSGCPSGVQDSRAVTPASLQASSEAGSFGGSSYTAAHHAAAAVGAAGPLWDRVEPGLMATAAQQQRQQQGSVPGRRTRVESPCVLEAVSGSGTLHMYSASSQAHAAGAPSPGAPGTLDQTLSEPLTAAALKEHRALHQQLSQPSAQQMEAAVAAAAATAALAPVPPAGAAAGRSGSSGSHGLLFGELSMDHPLASTTPATTAAGAGGVALASQESVSTPTPAAAAGAGSGVRAAAADAGSAAAAYALPHHHRRYVYRSTSPSAGSPDPLQQREAEVAGTPSPGSGIDSGDRALWASMPPTPREGLQAGGGLDGSAAAAGAPAVAAAAAAALGAESGAASAAAVSAPVSGRSSVGGTFAGAGGVTDSYDSNASSYAARRPVAAFKPYPPDSPRASQQQAAAGVSVSQRELGLAHRTSPVAGAAVGTGQRPYRSFVSSSQLTDHAASRYASYPQGSSSHHVTAGGPLAGAPGASYGSSGGGAPPAAAFAGSTAGNLPPGIAAGRGRSGRLSSSQTFTEGTLQHPGHLSIMIPPVQQCQISRVGTPVGSSGGLGGSGGSVGGRPGGAAHLPWGLPQDAALLTSSMSLLAAGVGSPAAGSAARSRPGLEPSRSQHHLAHRWSGGTAGGAAAERSLSTGSYKAALDPQSHMVSPLNSDQEGLIPAGIVDGAAGSGCSRATSRVSSDAAGSVTAAAAAVITSQMDKDVHNIPVVGEEDMYCLAGDGSDGGKVGRQRTGAELWAIVRKAHTEERRLLAVLEDENYSVVTKTFKKLFPREFDKAIPVFNHRKVDQLLLQWEAAYADLQRAEQKQRRTGRGPVRLKGKLGRLLCPCAVGCGCAGCDSCTDLLVDCCKEHTVQIIPEILAQINELEGRIEAERRKVLTRAFTPSWFVFFKTQKAAALAARAHIYAERSGMNNRDASSAATATKFQVHPAPGPEEVNWQHLWMSYTERDCRSVLTWPLLLVVVLFPITLITSAASRLEYVFCPQVEPGQPTPAFVWEWYCSGKEAGESVPVFMRAFITGWLPNLLLNLWLVMALPRLVYLVVQSEGSCFSLSALERRIGAVFFYWDIFNVFLQGTIGSTFFQQVRKIIQSPEQLPNILGAALPDSSNFFMQFIAMRALFLIWLRMCVPHGGVWQNWCHFCWCPGWCCSACNTERDRSLTYGPRTPRYGFEMGHMLLMYLIALAFAIVSPLLLPFSVVWFAFAWVAWRHNLTYVYQRKYESGGLMWVFLFSRIVMCLVIGQLFTFCVLAVRGAYWQAFLIIAFMPALTARYYKYCQARFVRGVESLPLEFAAAAPKLHKGFPVGVYVPPPLQESSLGWYPEWSKIWDGWGMPSYSL